MSQTDLDTKKMWSVNDFLYAVQRYGEIVVLQQEINDYTKQYNFLNDGKYASQQIKDELQIDQRKIDLQTKIQANQAAINTKLGEIQNQ